MGRESQNPLFLPKSSILFIPTPTEKKRKEKISTPSKVPNSSRIAQMFANLTNLNNCKIVRRLLSPVRSMTTRTRFLLQPLPLPPLPLPLIRPSESLFLNLKKFLTNCTNFDQVPNKSKFVIQFYPFLSYPLNRKIIFVVIIIRNMFRPPTSSRELAQFSLQKALFSPHRLYTQA